MRPQLELRCTIASSWLFELVLEHAAEDRARRHGDEHQDQRRDADDRDDEPALQRPRPTREALGFAAVGEGGSDAAAGLSAAASVTVSSRSDSVTAAP